MMKMQKRKSNQVKLSPVGSIAVGKTCLLNRLFHDVYTGDFTPATVNKEEWHSKYMAGHHTEIHVYDTTGSERFWFRPDIRTYGKCDIVLFVYKATDKESFERLINFWVPGILRIEDKFATPKLKTRAIGIVVRAQSDLLTGKPRQWDIGPRWAEQNGFSFFSVSAKMDEDGTNY